MLGATQRLREYGQFRPISADRGRPHRHPPQHVEGILDFFAAHPDASPTDAAHRFNVSQYFAWSVLKLDGQHPYHLQPVQELSDADRPARMAFCNWMHQQRQRSILWTDEATLGRVGLYNMHNEHLWARENPHAVRQKNVID